MVFKRRDKRSWARALRESLWPQGGWTRAFHYVKHRLHRLPDDPARISRGFAAGIFMSFSPLFGLHVVGAFACALLVRGNLLASLIGTFVGNPLTYPIFAFGSIKLGALMLGRTAEDVAIRPQEDAHEGMVQLFGSAASDLWHNFVAIFTAAEPNWEGLALFFHDVFWPYFVGSIPLGLAAALLGHYLSLPLIAAYQHRRRAKIKERLAELRAKLHARLEERAERKEERARADKSE